MDRTPPRGHVRLRLALAPSRRNRLTIDPTCLRTAVRRMASVASKPLAAITLPTIERSGEPGRHFARTNEGRDARPSVSQTATSHPVIW
jgi:hypothetical protein